MYKYPYTIMSGQGFGLRYSSIEQLDTLSPSAEFGQGKVGIFANIASGNLMVRDHVCRFEESNEPLEIYFMYNSMAYGNKWHLATGSKQFKALPNGQQAILIEPDGHETVFTYSSKLKCYLSPYSKTSQVRLNKVGDAWQTYDPETGIIEIYNAEGYLAIKRDREGHTTTYVYEGTPRRVKEIIGPSGQHYLFDYSEPNKIILRRPDAGGYKEALMSWSLNPNGSLAETKLLSLHTPAKEAYTITYKHFAAGGLDTITQSDQTQFSFQYRSNMYQVITLFPGGRGKSATSFDYKKNQVDVMDSEMQIITYKIDSNARIVEVEQERGYNVVPEKIKNITQYQYSEEGALTKQIDPDNGETNHDYELPGLRTLTTGPEGQRTYYYYDTNNLERPNLIAVAREIKSDQYAITRYIYDNNFDGKGNRCLRFQISPEGRVSEFEPYLKDAYQGQPKLKRNYYIALFDLSQYQPNETPSLETMREWVTKQDKQQTSLQTYAYDEKGKLVLQYEYAVLNDKGEEVENPEMGMTHWEWDPFGNRILLQKLQTLPSPRKSTSAYIVQKFDAAQRMTLNQDPFGKNTTYEYQANKVSTLFPNGAKQQQAFDSRGLLQETQQRSDELNQTRIESLVLDSLGRVGITIHPDKSQSYHYYDRQNNLAFTVSSLGRVVKNVIDPKNHYVASIAYANKVDIKKLWLRYPPPKGMTPSPEQLLEQLKITENPTIDRISYQFKDLSGRLAYEVDEDNFVTEYRYDGLDRVIGKITYEAELSESDLKTLLNGGKITLTPDATKDTWWQYFYDKDGNEIAQQDPGGYVTVKQFDAGNRCTNKIVYATPTAHLSELQDIIPAKNPEKDAYTYYYYNARNQCILEVDAHHYVNTTHYHANGKEAEAKRYATPLADHWRDGLGNQLPLLPPTHQNDQTTTRSYDLLERPDLTHLPLDEVQKQTFDTMGNLTLFQRYDGKEPLKLDPDFIRNLSKKYDQFQQCIQQSESADVEVNPYHFVFDEFGLKCKEINPLGETTLIYYDADHRPIATINPLGMILETTLNSFDEPAEIRKYKLTVSPEKLATLKGGLLTPEVRALFDSLKKDDADAIQTFDYTKRGLIAKFTEKLTDKLKQVVEKQWTALRKCWQEIQPLNQSQGPATFKIERTYEPRGLPTDIKKISDDGKLVTQERYAYENPLRLETSHTNALNDTDQKQYDRLGHLTRVIDKENITVSQIKPNAFGQPESSVDALDQKTTYDYKPSERSTTVHYPDGKSFDHVFNNVFGENVKQENAVGATQTWQHESSGLVTKHTRLSEQGNLEAIDQYDALHRLETHQDANQNVTKFERNQAGQVNAEVLNPDQDNLTTHFGLDSWGRKETVTNPRGIETHHLFDHKDQLRTAIIDPLSLEKGQEDTPHLNLVNAFDYNAQGTTIANRKSLPDRPEVFEEATLQDSLNRTTGHALDPKGLNLIASLRLDLDGKTISQTDQNNHTTWMVYDKNGLERFVINPEKGVVETRYYPNKQKSYTREYSGKLTQVVDETTTLQQMVGYADSLASSEDSQAWFFYDANGNERFSINSLGAVFEQQYDLANRCMATIRYAQKIDTTHLSTLKTADVEALVTPLKSDKNNRALYFARNALDRIVFEFDAKGYVLERTYDGNGNITIETLYAEPVQEAAELATKPLSEIKQALDQHNPQNETTYSVFNLRNQPLFTLKPEGNVIGHLYDENGNVRQACHFHDKLTTIPDTYEAIVLLLKGLVPSKDKGDRITTQSYDAADRHTKTVDPRDFEETLAHDAADNIVKTTNKKGQVWQTRFDGASREISTTSPKSKLTNVTYNPAVGTHGTLTYQPTDPTPVVRTKAYNKADNRLTVTEAAGMEEARTCVTTLNGCDLPISVEVLKVPVDNPDQNASFKTQTVQEEKTVKSQIRYDGKNKPIVTVDEADRLAFVVYDSEKNPCFTVDYLGNVIQHEYNLFNEVVTSTHYATPVTLTLSDYAESGIPLPVIRAACQANPLDRHQINELDQRGDVIQIKRGPVFYYLPNLAKKDAPAFGIDYAVQTMRYNAARLCYEQAKLINPMASTWERLIELYDRNHNKVATINPEDFAVITTFTAFDQEEYRTEYANQLTASPSPQITLPDLIKLTTPNEKKDRLFQSTYDLSGNLEKTIRLKAVVQKVDFVKGVPTLTTTTEVLVLETQHSPTGKPEVIIHENGAAEFIYYDERDLECGRAGIAFESLNEQNQPTVIIPLTYFGVNALGERVLTRQWKSGTREAKRGILATPIDTSLVGSPLELLLRNRRGGIFIRQDPMGTLFGKTYTARNKLARDWHPLTNWLTASAIGTTLVHYIDETRYGHEEGNGLLKALYRREITKETADLIDSTYVKRNAFQEIIAEGPAQGSYFLFRDYDNLGRQWRSNENKAAFSIDCYDLRDAKTALLQSPTHNLGEENDIAAILSWQITDLERTEFVKNRANQLVGQIGAAYHADALLAAQPVPISMQVQKQDSRTLLTWLLPRERNFDMTMTVWPVGNEDKKKPDYTIEALDETHCYIDLSQRVSDVYEYEINYRQTVQGKSERFYFTTGQMQIDTGNNAGSLNLVAIPTGDATLTLSGRVANLTSLELWQGLQKKAELPASLQLDLSHYPSGTYTLKPLYSDSPTPSHTLPFTIYTAQPSQTPLSREIDCAVNLVINGNEVTFNRTITAAFSQAPLRFSCNYLDDQDQAQQQQGTLSPSQQTVSFEHVVKTVTELSLDLQVKAGSTPEQDSWIPLLIRVAPDINALLYETKPKTYLQAAIPKGETFYLDQQPFSEPEAVFAALATTRKECAMTLAKVIADPANRRLLAMDLTAVIEQGAFTHEQAACPEEPAVFESYLSALQDKLALGPQGAYLYAKAKGLSLRIWQRKEENPTQALCLATTEGDITIELLVDQGQLTCQLYHPHHLHQVAKMPEMDMVMVSDDLKDDWQILEAEEEAKPLAIQSFGDPITLPFKPVTILYITPMTGFDTPPTLTFLDMQYDRDAMTKNLTVTGLTPEGIVVDASLLAPGQYPFTVGTYENLAFTINRGHPIYPSFYYPTHVNQLNPLLNQDSVFSTEDIIRPTDLFVLDAWGNCLQEENPLNLMWEREFNDANQEMVLKAPSTQVVSESGNIESAVPITYKGYDKRRLFIGETNPRGNTTAFFFSKAGHPERDILPDGTVTRFRIFNALSQETRYQDARGHWWQKLYDLNHRLIRFSFPSGKRFEFFGYNELGKVKEINNAANLPTRQSYDIYGYASQQFKPDGSATTRVNTRQGTYTKLTPPEGGDSLSNVVSYLGRIESHTDLGKANYKNTYDFKGQQTHRTSTGGEHGKNVWVNPIIAPGSEGSRLVILITPIDVQGENMAWTHKAGRVTQELDNSDARLKKVRVMGWDKAGRLAISELYENGQKLRTMRTQYNALGQEESVFDTNLTLTSVFDLAGNRAFISSDLALSLNNRIKEEHWNTFDRNDNVLLRDGIKNKETGKIEEGPNSYLYTYAECVRPTESHQGVVANLHYDNDGVLDTIGRGDQSVERQCNNLLQVKRISNTEKEVYQLDYSVNGDNNGQQFEKDGKLQSKVDLTLTSSGYVHSQRTENKSYHNGELAFIITDRMQYQYAKFDERKVIEVGGDRTIEDVKKDKLKESKYQSVKQYHTANGSVSAIAGQQDNEDPKLKAPSLTLFSTAGARILKQERFRDYENRIDGATRGPTIYNFLTVHDQFLGSYSSDNKSVVNFMHQGVTDQGGVEIGSPGYYGGRSKARFADALLAQRTPYVFEYADPAPSVVALPDPQRDQKSLQFSLPPVRPMNCIAMEGDTPSNVAERFYGSRSYSSLLEGSNGLMGEDSLYSGYPSLHLPPMIPSTNKAGSYGSYEAFTQKIIGSLYPYIKTPEFKQHIDVGQVFSTVVVEAIAVAVGTLIMGPAALAALGLVANTFSSMVAAGVSAALVDMAGQEVEMTVGMKDSFSWQEVGSVGIAAGTTVGVDSLSLSKTTANAILKAGIQSTAQQLGQMAFGIQHKFSVTQVAGAMATAGISEGVFKDLPKSIKLPMSSVVGAIVGALIEGGKLQPDLIAAHALGTLVGNVISEGIADIKQGTQQPQPHPKQSGPEPASSEPRQLGKSNRDNRQRLQTMNAKNRQANGNRPKLGQFKAAPSKDWAGWEEQAAAYLSEMVAEDLNPITDDEQIAQYYRNHPTNMWQGSWEGKSMGIMNLGRSVLNEQSRYPKGVNYTENYGNKSLFWTGVYHIAEMDLAAGPGIIAGLSFHPLDTSYMNAWQKSGYTVGWNIGELINIMLLGGSGSVAMRIPSATIGESLTSGLTAVARNASLQASTGLKLLASRFGFFKQPIQESGRDIVERVTHELAERLAKEGPQILRQYMKPGQWNAFIKNSKVASMQLGQGMHNGINEILEEIYGERFRYFRKGPDFLDTLTGEYIEVTTVKQLTEHMKRYAEKLRGVDIKYVGYELKY